MLASEIREILAEEEEVQRHKDALESLVNMREKLLREPLKARMRRGEEGGEWSHFFKEECAGIHKKEKRFLQSQLDRLQHERAQTNGRLANLRRLKTRAKLILTARNTTRRKGH